MVKVEKNSLISELEAMKQRMDRLYYKSFVEQEACRTDTEDEEKEELETWEPFMDIWESEDEWLVVADLPGVRDEDLDVEVMENQLTISGKREFVPIGKSVRASKAERPEGRFSRTFMLPPNAREAHIQAEFKRGVLVVKIPKDRCLQALPHKVIVQAE